ncbi:MAG TPA: alginate lyase family protein [Methylocystis sp.]|nr:alginate lyase family protein [Methylocystis sp.]
MRAPEFIASLRRRLEFVRHIALAKLVRRLELSTRRMWRDRFAPGDGAIAPLGAALEISDAPPQSIFAPRRGRLRVSPEALTFTFAGRAATFPRAGFDWGGGPSDQLWRMNFHGMEYVEDVDDALFEQLLRSWIVANPLSRRGAWRDAWNSYALSIRAVCWMQQLATRGEHLDASFKALSAASLARQLAFLERNLETDIGGNHLVKNIKALLWAARFFDGPAAARWRMKGLRLLQSELPRQVLPDGAHYERSPSYHNQVFADLIECRLALGAGALDGALDDALRRMARATVDLTHPDGFVCLFNDAGLTTSYSSAACLAAFAQIFGERPAPRRVFALREAGYFGARDERSYFVADCGRIAPDDLPAHGHADVLSFEWSIDGARMIVDQGVYEYVPGERRRRARSAETHNTLCFDEADQADFFGAFRCGRRPSARVLRYEAREDGFLLEGDHDGFSVLRGRPRHRRRFHVAPRQIEIFDWIDGADDRAAHIRFLLHPDVELTLEATRARLRRGATAVQMTATLPIFCKKAVWWADMGVEQETRRLSIPMAVGVREAVTIFRYAPS